MKTESELYNLLQDALKDSNISLWRIENSASNGIPDVCLSYGGKTGWIELKTLVPRKQSICSLKKLELSELQIVFLAKHVDSFVMVSFDGYVPILVPFLQLADYCEKSAQTPTGAVYCPKIIDFIKESVLVQENFYKYTDYLQTIIKTWMEN